MAQQVERVKRRRTLADKIITGLNTARYRTTEPLMLARARARFEHLYRDPDEYPLISVYVPTYNRGEILMERAVKSVLGQTYPNFEFIILGDCCTDNTAELVSRIDDARVIFYNIPTRGYRYPPTPENNWFAGPVVAANEALKRVRGKWIARLDDDDLWTPDHLEVLLRFAQEGNYEFASASYEAERHGKRYIVDAREDNPRIGGTQTWLYRSYLSFFKYNIHCWRKSWNKVNDTDIQQRIYEAGVRMGFLDRVVATIVPRPGETTIGLEAYLTAEKEGIRVHA